MKARFVKLISCSLALAALSVAGSALADPIQGYVWADAATPYVQDGNNPPFTIPQTTPGITFSLTNTVTPFVFNFYSSTDENLTGFLTTSAPNAGTNNNMVTYTGGVNQTSATPCPGGTSGACGINNDIMEFTGNAYLNNGQDYSFTHDDGMYLYVDGTKVINAGTPTAPDTNTFQWTGSTGVHSFMLYYDEVNGAPAELYSPDFGLTPEPSSLLLLGTGLAGMAFLLFRKRQRPTDLSVGNHAGLA